MGSHAGNGVSFRHHQFCCRLRVETGVFPPTCRFFPTMASNISSTAPRSPANAVEQGSLGRTPVNVVRFVSIVIPVYNEEKALDALFRELNRVFSQVLDPTLEIEVVLVNDGSKDQSWSLISAQCE